MAKKNGGPAPCGEHGCPLLHHPVLHNQMQGGHGGGIFPNWQKEKQQASMVKQQSKEDADIGEMHVQGPFTFSSGDLSRKNGETFPIFSGKKVTAPAPCINFDAAPTLVRILPHCRVC
jgi:hypothetical protein